MLIRRVGVELGLYFSYMISADLPHINTQRLRIWMPQPLLANHVASYYQKNLNHLASTMVNFDQELSKTNLLGKKVS